MNHLWLVGCWMCTYHFEWHRKRAKRKMDIQENIHVVLFVGQFVRTNHLKSECQSIYCCLFIHLCCNLVLLDHEMFWVLINIYHYQILVLIFHNLDVQSHSCFVMIVIIRIPCTICYTWFLSAFLQNFCHHGLWSFLGCGCFRERAWAGAVANKLAGL